jgi:ATP-dependent DNA helicase DinG
MAAAVADVIEQGGVLLVEAGTGTGKTLAYLVPAILSQQRVLVSTGTKTLQEQIYFKDLAVLRKALGVPFTATYMKGRGNYVCLHRFEVFRASLDAGPGHAGRRRDPEAGVIAPILERWVTDTETGDRAEIEELPEEWPLWGEIAASAENCLGMECPRYQECFVTRLRQRAAASDIVIVNHHLLCADAAVRQSAYGEVIPSCQYAVLDEAHQLEDVVTQYFGTSVTSHRVEELVRDGDRLIGLGAAGHDPGDLRTALDRVRDRGRVFFGALLLGVSADARTGPAGSDDRIRLTPDSLAEVHEDGALLMGALDNLEATIGLMKEPQEPATAASASFQDLPGLSRRAGEVRDQLRFILRAGDPDYVYFLERRGRGVCLRAAPIDVSTIVREWLLDRMQATVLTSATLTVDGSFDYVRGRLGLGAPHPASALRLASEFDYRRQAILYLPRRMPDPRSPMFAEAAAHQVVEILERTEGRAFVLFTSYAMLRAVRAFLERDLRYPMLVQGTMPRSALLREFRSTPHAVLLATASLWQGVDVMGEALSCVIIDKLPFASPADPITAARIEAVGNLGGEPFSDYQVPLAILTLLQGLGRLIRHRDDRGVLAILDRRLETKAYGRRFLNSLPAAPMTHDLGDIARFFAPPAR